MTCGTTSLRKTRPNCTDDVRVLRLCFMKFLHACQQTTQILPGVDNMTIASCSNKVWRTYHLERHSRTGASQGLPLERHTEQDGEDLASISQ